MKPLADMHVLTLVLNLPGPAAAARLLQLGAAVIKVEPPAGDPLALACPAWYRALTQGQEVMRLDLKSPNDRDRLDRLLGDCDLLLTATRPAALARLGLDWPALHARFPRLSQVAILGFAGEQAEAPGHDLTYQARAGLLSPPGLPRTLIADLAGAERVVSAALALLLARERQGTSGYMEVALAEAAAAFAAPLAYGLTTPGGILGGVLPGYNLYRTRQGWVAVAALEPHFRQRLEQELELQHGTREELERIFLARTAAEWEAWAAARDLPIAAVRDAPDGIKETEP